MAKKKRFRKMESKFFKKEQNPLVIGWIFLVGLWAIIIHQALSSLDPTVQQIVSELSLSSTDKINLAFILGLIIGSILVLLHLIMAYLIDVWAEIFGWNIGLELTELTVVLIWIDILGTVIGNILGLLTSVLGILYLIAAIFYISKLRK